MMMDDRIKNSNNNSNYNNDGNNNNNNNDDNNKNRSLFKCHAGCSINCIRLWQGICSMQQLVQLDHLFKVCQTAQSRRIHQIWVVRMDHPQEMTLNSLDLHRIHTISYYDMQ